MGNRKLAKITLNWQLYHNFSKQNIISPLVMHTNYIKSDLNIILSVLKKEKLVTDEIIASVTNEKTFPNEKL